MKYQKLKLARIGQNIQISKPIIQCEQDSLYTLAVYICSKKKNNTV